MKLFILTITILAVAQTSVTQDKCDGECIRNICHERLLLKGNILGPCDLAMDFNKNILLYSQEVKEFFDYTVAYINLTTNEYGSIDGYGLEKAVDTKKHQLYLGDQLGLRTFDFDTKTVKELTTKIINIEQMFYKDRLYYVVHNTDYGVAPSYTAYYYENGEAKKVEELKDTRVEAVAIDKKDNIIFSNYTGLFIFKRTEGKIMKVGDYHAREIIADNLGNIYFVTDKAPWPFGPIGHHSSKPRTIVYSVNDYNVVKIVELEDLSGIAIDNDNNIIYADLENIYKLAPSKKTCGGNKEITTNNIV